MFEILVLSFVFFLAILGLGELLHKVWMFLLRPKKMNNFLVLVLDDSCAAEQITAALEDIRWNGKNSARFLIGIDNGLSEENVDVCKSIEKMNDDFIFCKTQEIWQVIGERS